MVERSLYPTLLELGAAVGSGEVSQHMTESRKLKIGIAQIRMRATRISENAARVMKYIDEAERQDLDLVVFPELSLPGYCALDCYLEPGFIAANLKALGQVTKHTHGKHVAAIVGFVDRGWKSSGDSHESHFNSAAVVYNGSVSAIIDKTVIPDYDVFWERRYFTSARSNRPVVVAGWRIGIQICEDLWGSCNGSVTVADKLVAAGAEILINLSASPFEMGKYQRRLAQVASVARACESPFIYVNLIGAQDGYEGELVFDGRSIVVGADGEEIATAAAFSEDFLVVDVPTATRHNSTKLLPIAELWQALSLGIADYFDRFGFKRAYIGLSGGIDSAVVAALAVAALGPERVCGVTMPSHITSDATKEDALKLALHLGIKCQVRSIAEQYQSWQRAGVAQHGELANVTKQNVQARLRGLTLMEFANQDPQGVVLTTGNKTELALGYCTLYGDMCGGLAVISDVNKLRVYELAHYCNQSAGSDLIPQSIIDRIPTAELEHGQTDEQNLPGPYRLLVPLVDAIIEGTSTSEELERRFPSEMVAATVRLIHLNEYKRRQAAPGIRVTGKAFGGGRRMPLDNYFY